MSNKKAEVAVQENHALATPAASPFGAGLEAFTASDIQIPVAMLLQKQSKVFDDPTFPLRAGQVAHMALLEDLSALAFVPIKAYWDNRFDLPMVKDRADAMVAELGIVKEMMFSPDKGCVCYAPDGKEGNYFGLCSSCGKAEWDNTANKAPVCSKRLCVIALFEGYDFPVLIRFGKTSLKHGKKFLSTMMVGGGDIFSRKYKLAIVPASDGANSWFEMKVNPAGKVEDQSEALRWYNIVRTANVVTEEHEETVGADKAPASSEY